jgi:hypothetical protein
MMTLVFQRSCRTRRWPRALCGPRFATPATLVALITLLLAAGAPAAHADDDDWQVAARAGIASIAVAGRDELGPRLAVDGTYGLTDAWAIRVTASGSRHGVSEDLARGLPGGGVFGYSAFGGLSYTMDILRLLPSFEMGLGLLGVTGAVKEPRRALGMQAAIAADYLMSPRWSIGGIAEYVYAPFDLITKGLKGTAVPQAFALSVRICWTVR